MKDKNNAFVLSASPLIGPEDGKFLRTQGGYMGGVKVPGIDIFNFKDSDRENAMRAFGNAVSVVNIPTKYVFIGCRPDYETQKANVARHEIRQKHPYRKSLLERQRAWFEYYEKNEETRSAFVLFFAPDKKDIADAVNRYAGCLAQAKVSVSVCSEDDFRQLFRILLQGGGN